MTQEPMQPPIAVRISIDWLRLTSIALACIGLLSVLPMAWAKFTHATNFCPAYSGMNCELVVRTVYSQIGPLHVSYLGVVGYLAILAALLLEAHLPYARIITFGMTLFGFLLSGHLIAMEAFVLRAWSWCEVCTQIALNMTLLFIVSCVRLWSAIRASPGEEAADDAT